MTEFAAESAEEIKEKKLSLAKNGFDVAPDKIKHEHVDGEMPDAVVEKKRGEKLPGVGLGDTTIAEGEVFWNKRGFHAVRLSWAMKPATFTPSSVSKTTRCVGDQDRMKRDVFRPERRIKRDYRTRLKLSMILRENLGRGMCCRGACVEARSVIAPAPALGTTPLQACST